ncbi:DUF2076 domain-containing protein [uncultured Devosia sp.]|uniref:DUF2076 domain-containing protein n=1 Tax=uncultured Devosia sp. TaxID=211434 RepID=UPI0035CB0C2B
MLQPEDRDAIEGLFDRIETVAAKSGQRDADAEALIQQRLRAAPASPYFMAQTILVQERALQLAEQKIAELEAQIAQRPAGGGFLGGLFGDNAPQGERQQARRGSRGPWDRNDGDDGRQRGGGGFLAGAAQTALGVTSGVLLGSAIAGLLTGDANAQEYTADQPADEPIESADGDSNDNDDDLGDFDVGGDF